MTLSKVPTMEKDAAAAGVQGAARDTEVPETPPVGVAERHLESPTLHGVAQRNVVVPSLGGGIPVRWFRSPSRNMKADFRPFGCCMKRPENTDWPLR